MFAPGAMACCAHMSHILDTLAGPEGDDDAYRMLIMSSMKGSPQGIRAAVAAGASCTKVYNASTPLHCAVLGVNPAKAVATLLELDPTVVDGAKFDVMPRRPTTRPFVDARNPSRAFVDARNP